MMEYCLQWSIFHIESSGVESDYSHPKIVAFGGEGVDWFSTPNKSNTTVYESKQNVIETLSKLIHTEVNKNKFIRTLFGPAKDAN